MVEYRRRGSQHTYVLDSRRQLYLLLCAFIGVGFVVISGFLQWAGYSSSSLVDLMHLPAWSLAMITALTLALSQRVFKSHYSARVIACVNLIILLTMLIITLLQTFSVFPGVITLLLYAMPLGFLVAEGVMTSYILQLRLTVAHEHQPLLITFLTKVGQPLTIVAFLMLGLGLFFSYYLAPTSTYQIAYLVITGYLLAGAFIQLTAIQITLRNLRRPSRSQQHDLNSSVPAHRVLEVSRNKPAARRHAFETPTERRTLEGERASPDTWIYESILTREEVQKILKKLRQQLLS